MVKEVIILARGELTPEEIEYNLRFLGARGLRTEIIDPKGPRDFRERLIAQDTIYSIDEITSDQQFLAKEHFSEFRKQYRADLHPVVAGTAFSVLVNPKQYGYHPFSSSQRKYANPPLKYIPPENLGLVVRTRESVGLPLPLYPTANLQVVRVDSFLGFASDLLSGQKPKINGLTDKTEGFLKDVASHLKERFITLGVEQ